MPFYSPQFKRITRWNATRGMLYMILVFSFLACPKQIFAQRENVFLHPKKFYRKYFPTLKIKRDPPDSLYIKSYPNYLSVGMRVLSPSIRLDIAPRGSGMGRSVLRTNIPDIVGFSASYRFVSAGFAFLLNSGVQMHDNYARSRFRTATIKYNGGAHSLEFKYLRFKGLTEVNPMNRLSLSIPLIKRPDVVNKEFQFEGLYNVSWRKYSYIAPFTFSQRQVKSRAGFLLKPGVYYTELSSDTTLVNMLQAESYDNDFRRVKVIRTLSIRLAPGMGGNLIFLKRYYFSLIAFPSYDLYLYKLLRNNDDKVKGKHAFAFVFDGKASIGYQSRRFFGGIRYEVEYRNAALKTIQYNALYNYLGLELGYRFNAPRAVKKFYKETMPPGM